MQLEKERENNTVHAYFPQKAASTVKALNSAARLLKKQVEKTGAKIIFNDLHPLRISHNDQMTLFKELLSNAIKFNSSQPLIHVSCEMYGPDIVYKIEDNGIGVPSQMWGVVFKPYKKLYHEKKGEGIGLSLAKAILENYHGCIWVGESSSSGTTICFSMEA